MKTTRPTPTSILLIVTVLSVPSIAGCSDDAAADPADTTHAEDTVPDSLDMRAGEVDATPAVPFALTSAAFAEGDALPDDLKCTQDGGDGVSPPITWTDPTVDTAGFVVVMDHWPTGTTPGQDTPNHYWLLWNIPPDTRAIARGNPDSVGDEGGDKDGKAVGYTPPCSPPGALHTYTLHVFAVSAVPSDLGVGDDLSVTWHDVMDAIDGLVVESAEISFVN